MTWLAACKEYAASVGKWTVPKKGTPEYDAVKLIQKRMQGGDAPAPAPEVKTKVCKTKEAAPVVEKVVRRKRIQLVSEPAAVPVEQAVLEATIASATPVITMNAATDPVSVAIKSAAPRKRKTPKSVQCIKTNAVVSFQ